MGIYLLGKENELILGLISVGYLAQQDILTRSPFCNTLSGRGFETKLLWS